MDNKTARQDLETVIRVEDLALGSMRKLRAIQDWLRAEAARTETAKENIGTIGKVDYQRLASRAIADIATVTELLGVPEEESGRPIVELVQEFLAAQANDIAALRTILVDSVRLREPDFIIGDPQDPYLIRYWLRRDRPEGSIYLHCIRKSDDDRALHDHPWSSTSLVLEGTLREILPEGSRLLTPGTIVSRSAEQAHRLEVVDGPVWTLFITGAVEREWGFHCPNGWVHWKEFTDPATNGQRIGKGCGEFSDNDRKASEEVPIELSTESTCPDCGSHMELSAPWDPNCETFLCGECGFNEPEGESHE